jgi:hypothetical protein
VKAGVNEGRGGLAEEVDEKEENRGEEEKNNRGGVMDEEEGPTGTDDFGAAVLRKRKENAGFDGILRAADTIARQCRCIICCVSGRQTRAIVLLREWLRGAAKVVRWRQDLLTMQIKINKTDLQL